MKMAPKATTLLEKSQCPEDKSHCGCDTCDPELKEDCPDKFNPALCCQGCIDIEEGDFDE